MTSIRAQVSTTAKDWNAAQYLRFNDERTRPARELLERVPLSSPKRIVDLGCGPGNSTEILVARFPQSYISGIDSSPDMIAKATAALPKIRFTLENLDRYQPAEPVDLFFCNAVVQWLPIATRLKAITDLIRSQPSGGVFAFQAPDNLTEPSHEAMRDVAAQEPWATALAREPPGREPMETPREIYDVLGPYCSSIDIWHTSYQHVMESHEAIIEWVKGTGLRPFVDPLSGEERASFLAEYLRRLQSLYPVSKNGKVLFRFPRLFVVAVRH